MKNVLKGINNRASDFIKQTQTNAKRISDNLLLTNIRFILFISLLAVFYIANTRYAERKMRQINELQKELKELDWQYMAAKSQLMKLSMQTEVTKIVEPIGLKPLTQPPKKIIIQEGE